MNVPAKDQFCISRNFSNFIINGILNSLELSSFTTKVLKLTNYIIYDDVQYEWIWTSKIHELNSYQLEILMEVTQPQIFEKELKCEEIKHFLSCYKKYKYQESLYNDLNIAKSNLTKKITLILNANISHDITSRIKGFYSNEFLKDIKEKNDCEVGSVNLLRELEKDIVKKTYKRIMKQNSFCNKAAKHLEKIIKKYETTDKEN